MPMKFTKSERYQAARQLIRLNAAGRDQLREKLVREYGDAASGLVEWTAKRQRGAAAAKRDNLPRTFETTLMVWAGTPCHLCRKPLTVLGPEDGPNYLTMDRILCGGKYNAENVLPACWECNHERSNKIISAAHVAEYRAKHGRGGKYLKDGRRA